MNMHRAARLMRLAAILTLCTVLVPPATADKAVDDYNFAAWLYNNGKYDVAVGAYETFLKTFSTHEKAAEARFGLAQSLFHLNRFDEALPVYEGLRRDIPEFAQMAEVRFQLGQTCVAKKEFARGEQFFAEVIAAHPDHYLADWALARQGACLLSLDRYADAETPLNAFVARYAPDTRPPAKSDAVRQALRRMGDAGEGMREVFLGLVERSVFYLGIAQFNGGKFGDAIPVLERFLTLFPASSMAEEARVRQAQCLYRTDRFADAATAFAPAAAGDGPYAALAAFERGLALYKAKRFPDASAAMADMAARFPRDANAARAALYAGTFLYEGGDFSGAAGHLRGRTAQNLPLADEAAYWLGMSLLKDGKAAEAETEFAQALEKHGRSTLAGDMRLGLADARLAQENMAGAADAFADYASRFAKSDSAPQALYSAGVALHRAEMYAASDARCTEFLKAFGNHPQSVQVLFLSGENRFLQRQYEAAAERYREFLARSPEEPGQRARAHFRLAWCHRHGRRFDEALAALDKEEIRSAGKAITDESLYVRGACLFDLGRYGDAEKALAAYLKADARGRFADDAILKLSVAQARTGGMARAVGGFERFLEQYPDSELAAQTRYQLAEGLFELKRFDAAASRYAQVLEHADATALHPFAMLGLGLCAQEQGNWQEASARFGELAARHPASDLVPQALYRQGQALMKDQQWDAAETAFQALTSRFPKHELARPAWVAIGTSRQNRGAWEEAAKAFAQAAQISSTAEDQPRVLYELAWSHREAGREAESLQAFRRLADAFPQDPLTADACFHLAEAKYKEAAAAGDSPDENARKAFREAAALYSRTLDLAQDDRLGDKAWYRVGWCRWWLGEYAGAADAFDALARQYPRSELAADALFQAGLAMMQVNRPNEAIPRFEKLTSQRDYASFPYLPEAYATLGDGLLATGRTKEALAALAKAIATGGDGISATRAYFLSGKAHYQSTRYREAAESFSAVTQRTRDAMAAEAQFYLGQIEQAQDRFNEAIVAYLRIQAIYGAYPEWVAGALLEMGKCHEALGRAGEANRAFRQVVQDFPDTRWAALARERLNKE